MNSSASEEILSAAEVPKTNQVTVATVTTTNTTITQTGWYWDKLYTFIYYLYSTASFIKLQLPVIWLPAKFC